MICFFSVRIPTITEAINTAYTLFSNEPPQPDCLTEFDTSIDSYRDTGLPIPLECLPLCGMYAGVRVISKLIFSESSSQHEQLQELESVRIDPMRDTTFSDGSDRKKFE